MLLYPYVSPIILNDSLFLSYGGATGTSVTAQRNAAYLISEMTVTEEVGTYLLPTIVTGSYIPESRLTLNNTWVSRVILVRFLNSKEEIYYTVTGTANYDVDVYDAERGLIDVDFLIGHCGCVHGTSGYPNKIQVVYESGFPTGTANQPDILLALTTYATIILNEITGYGNEAPGDVGVESYSNQDYKESRVALLRTTFGTSAKANFIHNLLSKYTRRQHVGLGY